MLGRAWAWSSAGGLVGAPPPVRVPWGQCAPSHIRGAGCAPLQAGVDASQLESYRQLWRMVAPEPEQADTMTF